MSLEAGPSTVVSHLGYVMLVVMLWLLVVAIRFVFNLFSEHGGVQFSYTKDAIINLHLNGVSYPVSYHSERGGRAYQEDRYHAQGASKDGGDTSLFGVYDGHGGAKAAQFCRDNMLDYIASAEAFETDTHKALLQAFERLNSEFTAIAKGNDLSDGSTAVVAVVHNRRVSVANVGDSRGILVHRGGSVTPLSFDHCPNRKDEEARIRQLGGRVIHWGRWRVQGILAVSRAIGDVNLHPYVIGDPEILHRALEDGDWFLVLASDGLWDVMRNEDVGRFVMNYRDKKFANVARDLCFEALILGSQDNITVQVIDLRLPVTETLVVTPPR